VDLHLARAAYRAARDVEGQVEHWAWVGLASQADVAEARARTRRVHEERKQAQAVYTAVARRYGTYGRPRSVMVLVGVTGNGTDDR
jgi:hypothetical protein